MCVCVTRACHAAEETVGKERRPAAVYRRGILYCFSVNYTCNARVKTSSELETNSVPAATAQVDGPFVPNLYYN